MSCVHINPTNQTSLEYFKRLDGLTKAGIRCWMCHIDALEKALRDAREDDRVGGGLTTVTIDRINELVGSVSDASAEVTK